MNCIRCGRGEKLTLIEQHHIVPKIEGGSNDSNNKEPRCIPCHKYAHAKLKILKAIEVQKRGGRMSRQLERIAVLEYRLKVLKKLNTPELIRERGTYQCITTRRIYQEGKGRNIRQ